MSTTTPTHSHGAEYVSGNIFIRQMHFPADRPVVDGHEHNFDHTTYIVRGSVLIEQLDEAGNVVRSITKSARDGFNWALIKAGVRHRLTALEPNSLGHCIYSHRNPHGDVVVDYDGWTPAYV